jgi:hypothetical protein
VRSSGYTTGRFEAPRTQEDQMHAPDDADSHPVEGGRAPSDGMGEHESSIPWPDPDPAGQIGELVEQVQESAARIDDGEDA